MKNISPNLRTTFTALFLSTILLLPLSLPSSAWDTLTDQIVPEDIVERPPEVPYGEDFNNDVFTRENFYDKSAGTRQHRRAIRAPKKDMTFEVYNPVEDEEAVSEAPAPETGVVKKDGKAVTVISIKEESESSSTSK